MAEVIISKKQNRVRCTDEKFLEAVYSSKTYSEIAEKTGQKVPSTMARYARTKKMLSEKGIALPSMERKKPVRHISNVDNMIKIVERLKKYNTDVK
jgi:hypothetical protein